MDVKFIRMHKKEGDQGDTITVSLFDVANPLEGEGRGVACNYTHESLIGVPDELLAGMSRDINAALVME